MNVYLGLPHKEIASQIAALLNTHNQLAQKRSLADVLEGKTGYVVELHGRYVIAACGIEKQSHSLSELKHLVVHPNWRRRGVGRYVARRALEVCSTPLIYATARAENEGSLKTLLSVGFTRACHYNADGRTIELLTRTTPKCQVKQVPNWKSASWLDPEAETRFGFAPCGPKKTQ